ncbi:unnamed protein product [Amaranthus hypochondriacus]
MALHISPRFISLH